MKRIYALLLMCIGFSAFAQEYFAHPFNPCLTDTAFSILEFEPVMNGVQITDSSDISILSDAEGSLSEIPESAINGDKIDLSQLEPNTAYQVTIVSASQSTFYSTFFVIRDLAGTLHLNDADPGVTTVELFQTQTLEVYFEHDYPEIIEEFVIKYGDGRTDTLDSLSLTYMDHKYAEADTYFFDLTVVTGDGGCSLDYRNHAVVKDANGLGIRTVIGDTVSSVGDSNGVITLCSEYGGTPPYMFAFSTSPFGYNRAHDDLPAGYYRVSIKDSIGCIADTNIRVKSPDPIIPIYDIDLDCETGLADILMDTIKGE
jgi:hypothetical protein